MIGGFLRWILSAAAFLVLAIVCQGQAKYAGTGPGSLVTVGATLSGYQIDYGHRDLGGFTAYVDANVTWRLGVEGEARFLRYHQQADTNETTYLVGPRLSFGKSRWNPYMKGLVGMGRLNFPYNYGYGTYFAVAAGGGVDLRLTRRMWWRVIDAEYQDWPQFTVGGPSLGALHPYGISSGISFSILRSGTKQGY
jgi:hypothetical protein